MSAERATQEERQMIDELAKECYPSSGKDLAAFGMLYLLYFPARILGFLLIHVPVEAFLEVSHAVTARGSVKHEAQIFRTWRAQGATFSFFDGDITDLAPFFVPPFFVDDGNCFRFAFHLFPSCIMPLLLDGFAWL